MKQLLQKMKSLLLNLFLFGFTLLMFVWGILCLIGSVTNTVKHVHLKNACTVETEAEVLSVEKELASSSHAKYRYLYARYYTTVKFVYEGRDYVTRQEAFTNEEKLTVYINPDNPTEVIWDAQMKTDTKNIIIMFFSGVLLTPVGGILGFSFILEFYTWLKRLFRHSK